MPDTEKLDRPERIARRLVDACMNGNPGDDFDKRILDAGLRDLVEAAEGVTNSSDRAVHPAIKVNMLTALAKLDPETPDA